MSAIILHLQQRNAGTGNTSRFPVGEIIAGTMRKKFTCSNSSPLHALQVCGSVLLKLIEIGCMAFYWFLWLILMRLITPYLKSRAGKLTLLWLGNTCFNCALKIFTGIGLIAIIARVKFIFIINLIK